MNQELTQKQYEVNEQRERHHAGNEQFRIALTNLVTLASHPVELFDRSKTDEKRELTGYLCSNMELEGSKLRYTLRKPFDLFADLANHEILAPGPNK